MRTASVGGRAVRASNGLRVGVDAALEEVECAHTLVVVGGPGARREDPVLAEEVARVAARSLRVVAVCTGAFVLGRAGLLEGLRVATGVDLGGGERGDRSGACVGGAGPGRAVALEVVRSLVVFLRRPGGQAQFSAVLAWHGAQRPGVREVQHWVVERSEAERLSGCS